MARPKIKAKWYGKKVVPDRSPPDVDDIFTDIEVNQCSPHLCAICDYEGDLVICDGHCHRQSHRVAREGDAVGDCPGVLIPDEKMDEAWMCLDCRSGMAMCFKCHTVGIF